MNWWSVHHDLDSYPDPSEFNPGHFYDPQNNQVIKREVILFSSGTNLKLPVSKLTPFFMNFLGKRDCLGRSLAEVELFLYLTSIVQKFNIKPIDNENLSFEKELGITLSPKKVPILKFVERN